MDDVRRLTVVLPSALLAETDAVAGRRRRSVYIAEAVREKLERERMRRTLHEAAGSIDVSEYSDSQQ